MADQLGSSLKPWPVPAREFRVEDYGAVADGRTVNTRALQRAIDACTEAGGGTVRLTKGDYVSGTIELKDGVMLQIDKDARLVASLELADYPDHVPRHPTVMDSHYQLTKSLIYAEGRERIGLSGAGTIDGRGTPANFPGPEGPGPMPGRPFLIRVIECRQVVVDGLHLHSAAAWLEDYLNCEDLIFRGVSVENHVNWNNDGFDIDGCRNVLMRDCFINAEDDGLCFKGTGGRTTENVLVENCRFYSTCNAIKFGTDSQGGLRDVVIRHVEAGGPAPDMEVLTEQRRHRAISGVSWESTDGGSVENVLVADARIVRTEAPVFLYVGSRGRVMPGQPKPKPGTVRRVAFEHITGEDNGVLGSAIVGLPGAPVEDVVVDDYKVGVAGGGTPAQVAAVPEEKPGDYPESLMFGPAYPAYGFYVRHARDVRLDGLSIEPKVPDARPCVGVGADAEGVLVDGKAVSLEQSGVGR